MLDIPQQRFSVSHLNEADFKTDGLRPYAEYRDLGIAAATGGRAQAHVIRHTVDSTKEQRVSGWHTHDLQFQMVYCLKGWIHFEFEGQGEQIMRPGSCWLMPPNIKHKVLGTSEDMELLEIVMPADFDTNDAE